MEMTQTYKCLPLRLISSFELFRIVSQTVMTECQKTKDEIKVFHTKDPAKVVQEHHDKRSKTHKGKTCSRCLFAHEEHSKTHNVKTHCWCIFAHCKNGCNCSKCRRMARLSNFFTAIHIQQCQYILIGIVQLSVVIIIMIMGYLWCDSEIPEGKHRSHLGWPEPEDDYAFVLGHANFQPQQRKATCSNKSYVNNIDQKAVIFRLGQAEDDEFKVSFHSSHNSTARISLEKYSLCFTNPDKSTTKRKTADVDKEVKCTGSALLLVLVLLLIGRAGKIQSLTYFSGTRKKKDDLWSCSTEAHSKPISETCKVKETVPICLEDHADISKSQVMLELIELQEHNPENNISSLNEASISCSPSQLNLFHNVEQLQCNQQYKGEEGDPHLKESKLHMRGCKIQNVQCQETCLFSCSTNKNICSIKNPNSQIRGMYMYNGYFSGAVGETKSCTSVSDTAGENEVYTVNDTNIEHVGDTEYNISGDGDDYIGQGENTEDTDNQIDQVIICRGGTKLPKWNEHDEYAKQSSMLSYYKEQNRSEKGEYLNAHQKVDTDNHIILKSIDEKLRWNKVNENPVFVDAIPADEKLEPHFAPRNFWLYPFRNIPETQINVYAVPSILKDTESDSTWVSDKPERSEGAENWSEVGINAREKTIIWNHLNTYESGAIGAESVNRSVPDRKPIRSHDSNWVHYDECTNQFTLSEFQDGCLSHDASAGSDTESFELHDVCPRRDTPAVSTTPTDILDECLRKDMSSDLEPTFTELTECLSRGTTADSDSATSLLKNPNSFIFLKNPNSFTEVLFPHVDSYLPGKGSSELTHSGKFNLIHRPNLTKQFLQKALFSVHLSSLNSVSEKIHALGKDWQEDQFPQDFSRYSKFYVPQHKLETNIWLYPVLQDYFVRLVEGPPFRPGEEMKFEAIRLNSFREWPQWATVAATRLARAGFYYSGHSDEVICFSCGGRIKQWARGDSALGEHRKFFPECPFIKGRDTENVPLIPPGELPDAASDPFSTEVADSVASRRPGLGRNERDGEIVTTGVLLAETLNTPVNNPNMSNQSSFTGHQYSIPSGESFGFAHYQGTAASIAAIQRGLDNRDSDRSPQLPVVNSLGAASLMKSEASRLQSYATWPISASIRPQELAKCGFYYTGTDDRVKCAFCSGILRNWEQGDQAMREHRRHFPTCPFILGMNVGNIPVDPEPSNLPQAIQESITAGGNPQDGLVRNVDTVGNVRSEDLGIMTERPKNIRFAVEAVRVATFKNWPQRMKQTPELLAKAGFYYAGFADNVKCFFCDGGLRNWEDDDDPWVEHARWFPRCGYVKQCKGLEFISTIDEKYPRKPPQPPPSDITAAAGTFQVEAREIKARMDTPTVRAVLEMGLPRTTVKTAIERKMRTTGDDFPSAESLLEAVFEIEEAMNRENRQQSEGAAAAATSAEPPSGKSQQKPKSGSKGKDETKKKDEKKPTKDKKKKNKKPGSGNVNSTSSTVAGGEGTGLEGEPIEAQSLKEENLKLKEQRTCKICMDEEVSIVFLPCGHLVCCVQCAPALRVCPICRSTIKGTVRTFLS